MPCSDPENADLIAALGEDLPEHLRFRNGLAPWERPWPRVDVVPFALEEALAEEMRRREPPGIIWV